MISQKEIDELNAIAVKQLKALDIKRLAVAVSGSAQSLILLNAAVQATDSENVVAITADDGSIKQEVIDIINKACESVNVEFVTVPLPYEEASDSNNKSLIFPLIMHEAWIRGFDLTAFGCTDSNINQGGNEILSHMSCVICPFCDFN